MQFYYIHGFNSSANTSSVQKLADAIQRDVIGLSWNSNDCYKDNIRNINIQITEECILVGTSMGGFYANQLLTNPFVYAAALFNPCMFPYDYLLGLKDKYIKDYETGHIWKLKNKTISSYNYVEPLRNTMKGRIVFLGDNDDIVDNKENEKFFSEIAQVEYFRGVHRISSFEQFSKNLVQLEYLICI